MIFTKQTFVIFRTGGRADGRADGRTDGRVDGRMDGRTDGRTDAQNYNIGNTRRSDATEQVRLPANLKLTSN